MANDAGEVVLNMGGGVGPAYSTTTERRSKVGIRLDKDLDEKHLPEGFLQSDELLVRYVNPSGVMVIDETWHLTDGE